MESPRFDTETGQRLEQFPPVPKPEPPTLDLKTEKVLIGDENEEQRPDSEKSTEVQPELPADYLENDERYKGLVQEASREYLKSPRNDGLDYDKFLKREGYTWQNEKLIDKSGKEVMFPSQLLSGDPYMDAVKNAKEKFANEYPEDSNKYTEREKIRIYEDPSSDPAYKSLDREILASTNRLIADSQRRRGLENADEERRLWDRENYLNNLHGWSRFVTLFPEKAAAYASKNEFIAKELSNREK